MSISLYEYPPLAKHLDKKTCQVPGHCFSVSRVQSIGHAHYSVLIVTCCAWLARRSCAVVPEETSLLERRTIFAWYGMDGNRKTVREWSSVFGNFYLQATGDDDPHGREAPDGQPGGGRH